MNSLDITVVTSAITIALLIGGGLWRIAVSVGQLKAEIEKYNEVEVERHGDVNRRLDRLERLVIRAPHALDE
jgi:hypothetical protein